MFPLHSHYRASLFAIRFQLRSTYECVSAERRNHYSHATSRSLLALHCCQLCGHLQGFLHWIREHSENPGWEVLRLHTRPNPFVTTFILCATPHKSKNDLIRNTSLMFYVLFTPMNVRFYYSIGTVKIQTQNPRQFILFVSLNYTVSSLQYVF